MTWPTQASAVIGVVSLVDKRGVAISALLTRRTITPGLGEWCFPCGYINGACTTLSGEKVQGENWFDAASREFREETGIDLDPRRWRQMGVFHSGHRGHMMLVAALAIPPKEHDSFIAQVNAFEATDETDAVKLVTGPHDCAFPVHETILNAIFAE